MNTHSSDDDQAAMDEVGRMLEALGSILDEDGNVDSSHLSIPEALELEAVLEHMLGGLGGLPKRNSDAYWQMLTEMSEDEELPYVIKALNSLVDAFNWRAVVDLMALYVLQIERSPQIGPGNRDLTGVIDLRTIIMIDADEEQVLRLAAEQREILETEEGASTSHAFKKALEANERGIAMARRWLPAWRAGFAAAVQGGRDPVRGALYRAMPAEEKDDPKELIRAALVLGTAATGIRNKAALTSEYHRRNRQGLTGTVTHQPLSGWNIGLAQPRPRRDGR